jgi:hypothetical protein
MCVHMYVYMYIYMLMHVFIMHVAHVLYPVPIVVKL